MRCLKPKVGTGTILKDTPDHFTDIGMFKLYDLIARPLEVIPLRRKKIDIPNYQSIVDYF